MDGVVRIWDVAAGREVAQPRGHTAGITNIALTPDGRLGLTSGVDETLRLWDLRGGQQLQQWPSGFAGPETMRVSLSVAAGAKRCLAHSLERVVVVGEPGAGDQLLKSLSAGKNITTSRFAPDGSRLLAGYHDGTVRLWAVESGKELRHWLHAGPVGCLAWSPDGRRILVGGADRLVWLWDVPTGLPQEVFEGHQDQVVAVAFSPDGRHALSAGDDATVRLWKLPPVPATPPPREGRRPERAVIDGAARTEAILSSLRAARAENCVFCAPDVPQKKEQNARASFAIPAAERVLAVVDLTTFGSAKVGLAFGTQGVYYHGGDFDPPGAIPYDEFRSHTFDTAKDLLRLDGSRTLATSGMLAPYKLAHRLLDVKELLFPRDSLVTGLEHHPGLGCGAAVRMRGRVVIRLGDWQITFPLLDPPEKVSTLQEHVDRAGIQLSAADWERITAFVEKARSPLA
jgi:hypothetical protein